MLHCILAHKLHAHVQQACWLKEKIPLLVSEFCKVIKAGHMNIKNILQFCISLISGWWTIAEEGVNDSVSSQGTVPPEKPGKWGITKGEQDIIHRNTGQKHPCCFVISALCRSFGSGGFQGYSSSFLCQGEIPSLLKEICGSSGSGWNLWDLMCFAFLMVSLRPKTVTVLRKPSKPAVLHRKYQLSSIVRGKWEYTWEKGCWEGCKMKWVMSLPAFSGSNPNVTFCPFWTGCTTGKETQL